ncbi:MAG: hypothetical protein JXD23_03140 [Spirochaetales bacterium]|nr:hypothetical protein [Spirochaetales bacterium]
MLLVVLFAPGKTGPAPSPQNSSAAGGGAERISAGTDAPVPAAGPFATPSAGRSPVREAAIGGDAESEIFSPFGPVRGAAAAAAVDRDGMVVAAGWVWNGRDNDFALARFAPDGEPDEGFGTRGRVATAVGPGDDFIRAAAIQTDGRIVAAGTSYGRNGTGAVAARYERDGSLDRGFGAGGMTPVYGGASSQSFNAVAVQTDGRIVTAGYSGTGPDGDFLLMRFLPDGSRDPSFGENGVVLTDFGASADAAFALAIQPDGKIVAGGETARRGPPASGSDFALARYTAGGRLDPGFGVGGKTVTEITSADDRITSLALAPDGTIVAAGYAGYGRGADFALARYDAGGRLDPAFGNGGLRLASAGPGDDVLRSVAVRPDGDIVAAGYSFDGARNRITLAGFLRSGRTDPGFGENGVIIVAAGAGDSYGYAVVLGRDGAVVVAGSARGERGEEMSVVRLGPGGMPPKRDSAASDTPAR